MKYSSEVIRRARVPEELRPYVKALEHSMNAKEKMVGSHDLYKEWTI
jgi:hypothetical protein